MHSNCFTAYLHCKAIGNAHLPHHYAASALFALLNFKAAFIEHKLRK